MKKISIYYLNKILIHLLFWFLVWVFFKFFFSSGTTSTDFIFWFSLLLTIITVTGAYVVIYSLIPNYLLHKKYKLFALYIVYLLIFITSAAILTVFTGFAFFYRMEYKEMPVLIKSVSVILVCVFFIITLVSVLKLLRHNYKSLEKNKSLENKILQAKLQLKEQELKFLKMQIHPHFLFNSLNTIYGFALKKKDEAPEMILKLSNLLDYILYQVEKPTVNLQDEIHHLEDYVSLEEMRFHDSLNVTFNKVKFNSSIQIAPMLLIPFLENSFKHGKIIDKELTVEIDLNIENNNLIFEITNSSDEVEKGSKGIGLENIQKRLEMLYPNAHQLDVEYRENQFRVRLQITIDGLKTKSND